MELTPRGRRLGDAAIAVLAESGSRALTHRAVDERAGLPPGSTSNLARSRAALLELALARMAELDLAAHAGIEQAATGGNLAATMAAAFRRVLVEDRSRAIARYELALESTRRPELRLRFDAESDALNARSRAVLAAAGSTDPDRHARQVLAFMEGLQFVTAVDGRPVPAPAELHRMFDDLLSGMLRPGG
ncbi:TetR/AcrR family transcriptional regulator [Pseudonocardia petroleophila]|uniref:TetR/AcrR family transcriptional regulator n=1 Tax=Pseudonocardia petroleophila TaxID=37331 RepID=A0A7G7MJX8_9PSEU|nr:TetR/AcrR family transcriptional regulator [Pseudonocardia petroleophila]QNG53089.1 TetR/AcrR family transcriptional regulator [Pseudonocardia petroleophila]